jgi:hypothetical protein
MQLAPRHPSLQRRSLILWAGRQAGSELPVVADRDVIGALALPLKYAAAQPEPAVAAREAGMGVVLAGQAWLNQLPPLQRGRSFGRLAYAREREWDPVLEPDAELADYAERYLDAQLAAGATLVTTPAHVLDGELGRTTEVALAEASVAVWRERQGWRPPAQRPEEPPRELYAGIAVRGQDLPGGAAQLAERYAALDVDGHWITVFDGDGSPAQLDAVAELALTLQAGGRPAVVTGAGAMHEALLASGVAATCAGLHAMRPRFPPTVVALGEQTGVGIGVYHPAILGAVAPRPGSEPLLARLFALHPCPCGAHPANEPPRGRGERVRHNTRSLAEQARDSTRLMPMLDEARLASRVANAGTLRTRLGLRPLPRGWTAVAARAGRLRTAGAVANQA